MCQMVVSLEAPNPILAVETSNLQMLGYVPRLLVGQSIKILQGPETETHELGKAILDSSLGNKFSEFQSTLYEASGHPRKILLSFSPCSRPAGGVMCCLITLTNYEERPLATPVDVPFEAYRENPVYRRTKSQHCLQNSCSLQQMEPSIFTGMRNCPSAMLQGLRKS